MCKLSESSGGERICSALSNDAIDTRGHEDQLGLTFVACHALLRVVPYACCVCLSVLWTVVMRCSCPRSSTRKRRAKWRPSSARASRIARGGRKCLPRKRPPTGEHEPVARIGRVAWCGSGPEQETYGRIDWITPPLPTHHSRRERVRLYSRGLRSCQERRQPALPYPTLP